MCVNLGSLVQTHALNRYTMLHQVRQKGYEYILKRLKKHQINQVRGGDVETKPKS